MLTAEAMFLQRKKTIFKRVFRGRCQVVGAVDGERCKKALGVVVRYWGFENI